MQVVTSHRPVQRLLEPGSTLQEREPLRQPEKVVDGRYLAIGEAVFRWELLRLVYNLALVVTTVLMVLVEGLRPLRQLIFLELVVFGAVGANLCYCLGPVLEAWIAWFIGTHRAVTGVLFVVGTLFAMLLTAMIILAV